MNYIACPECNATFTNINPDAPDVECPVCKCVFTNIGAAPSDSAKPAGRPVAWIANGDLELLKYGMHAIAGRKTADDDIGLCLVADPTPAKTAGEINPLMQKAVVVLWDTHRFSLEEMDAIEELLGEAPGLHAEDEPVTSPERRIAAAPTPSKGAAHQPSCRTVFPSGTPGCDCPSAADGARGQP